MTSHKHRGPWSKTINRHWMCVPPLLFPLSFLLVQSCIYYYFFHKSVRSWSSSQTDRNLCLSNFSALLTSSVLTKRFLYIGFLPVLQKQDLQSLFQNQSYARELKNFHLFKKQEICHVVKQVVITIGWLCLLSNLWHGAEPEVFFWVCKTYSMSSFSYTTGFWETHGYSVQCSCMGRAGCRCWEAKVVASRYKWWWCAGIPFHSYLVLHHHFSVLL